MKKMLLVLALVLSLGATQVRADSNRTTDPTAVVGATPTQATTAQIAASPATVAQAAAGETTKGGQPVSGSLETTLMLLGFGLMLVTFGAYQALKA